MTIAATSFSENSPRSVTDKTMAWKASPSSKFSKKILGSRYPSIGQGVSNMSLHAARMNASISARHQMLQLVKLNSALMSNSSIMNVDMKQTLPQHGAQSVKPKRRVSFCTMATVHSRPAYTDVDQRNSWYTNADYASFETDRQRSVHALHTMHGGNVISLEFEGLFSVWGLEKTLTRRQALQRKYHTMQHSFAVLQQQFLNKKNGILYDDVSIQAASERNSGTASNTGATKESGNFNPQYYLQRQRLRQQSLSAVLDQALSL